jgi:Ribosomal_S17 N-terminal
MATELTVQSERAFQKQPHIFLNHKSKAAKSKKGAGKGGRRWYKDVGLGFRTPKTAIEGTYIGMRWTPPLRLDRLFCHFASLKYTAPAVQFVALANHAQLDRQEMSFHRHGLDTWSNPHRQSRLHENAPNPDHPTRIPAFHPQICKIRETTQQPGGTRLARIPC